MRLPFNIFVCLLVFTILFTGCAQKTEEPKGQAVAIGAGAGAGALIGQLIFASTPGTIIPAAIGAGATAVYLKVTEEEEVVVEVVEQIPEPIDDSYYVVPIDNWLASSAEGCTETTLTLKRGFENQVLPVQVCKQPDNRWLIQAI